MRRSIVSAGVDIGTTTSQLVLSRLEMADVSPAFSVARIEITGREVMHRGEVGFTPVLPDGRLDGSALREMVAREYARAGVEPDAVEVGAVIVTGESAGRLNAREVADALAGCAGSFVAATAGAELEAILAGHGSGAAERSRREGISVLNLDVGGGTANAALFRDGRCRDAWAMDVGGRLLRIAPGGGLLEVSDRIRPLVAELGLDLVPGRRPDPGDLSTLLRAMASALLDGALGREGTPGRRALRIGRASLGLPADVVTVSGGVGACLGTGDDSVDPFRFGDAGPLLARALREVFAAEGLFLEPADETLRATVIGAGSHAVAVSGSTVACSPEALPLRDVPVARLFEPGEPEDFGRVRERLERAQARHGSTPAAFWLEGLPAMAWRDVVALAEAFAGFYRGRKGPVLALSRHDFAKALGQAIAVRGAPPGGVVCLDGVSLDDGDYVDIGTPLGEVVPLVVKTLVFRAGGGERKEEA